MADSFKNNLKDMSYSARHQLIASMDANQDMQPKEALPRKRLHYHTPEELFDAHLDRIYALR